MELKCLLEDLRSKWNHIQTVTSSERLSKEPQNFILTCTELWKIFLAWEHTSISATGRRMDQLPVNQSASTLPWHTPLETLSLLLLPSRTFPSAEFAKKIFFVGGKWMARCTLWLTKVFSDRNLERTLPSWGNPGMAFALRFNFQLHLDNKFELGISLRRAK